MVWTCWSKSVQNKGLKKVAFYSSYGVQSNSAGPQNGTILAPIKSALSVENPSLQDHKYKLTLRN